jgi:hypothetical protein
MRLCARFTKYPEAGVAGSAGRILKGEKPGDLRRLGHPIMGYTP